MNDVHVVLGAAGATGEPLVARLVALGLPVRAVHRRALPERPGVENVVADVSTPQGARRALEGAATAYVVVQPAYTRWVQEFPGLVSVIADAAVRAGARLVFLDNLYGYGHVAGPIHEALPQTATTRKGKVRAAIAADLLARHARGDLAVAIGRASDYIGPRGASLPNNLTLQPVAGGRRGRWLGRLDVPHSLSYTADVAAHLAVLGTRDDAVGRAWHLPVLGSPTGREFVGLAHRVGGVDGAPRLVTPFMNRLAGLVVPVIREGDELMYEFTEPFVVDDSAFRAAFPGEAVTDLETAVAASLDGLRRRESATA
jgi:nucleoside-diphosphate-sugar epimerase